MRAKNKSILFKFNFVLSIATVFTWFTFNHFNSRILSYSNSYSIAQPFSCTNGIPLNSANCLCSLEYYGDTCQFRSKDRIVEIQKDSFLIVTHFINKSINETIQSLVQLELNVSVLLVTHHALPHLNVPSQRYTIQLHSINLIIHFYSSNSFILDLLQLLIMETN